MFSLLFLLLAITGQSIAQTSSLCEVVTPVEQHKVTMTYYNRIPQQTAPISTVYRQLVYRTAYAVNCDLATILMVDDNLPQTGQYTTRTTIDALTMDRVACIQETSIVTRRDIRGFPAEEFDLKHRALETPAPHNHEKRMATGEAVIAAADAQAADVPPNSQSLSLRAYRYIVEVNSALFAINLVQSGFNLNATCLALRDPVTMARLYPNSIDPVQTADIICFAAQFGLYFNVSTAQILSDLIGIIYSIEVKSGWTTDQTALCSYLESNLSPTGFLGIDADGIHDFVCGNNASSVASSTTSASTGFTIVSGTAVSSGSSGSAGTITAPFANSTTTSTDLVAGSGSTAGATYSANATFTESNGPAASASHHVPISGSYNITFPTATGHSNDSLPGGGRLPPSPITPPPYGVWTTSTTPAPHMPRY